MIPRILYGYLLREFLKVFAATLAGLLVVCLVGDAAERLNEFIDASAPVRLILLFYLYQIPYYLIYILPATSLIATLFTLGQLGRHNELTAMLSSGVSLGRIFAPLFVAIFLVSAASFFIDEAVVPAANDRKTDIIEYQISRRARPGVEIRQGMDYQGELGRRWVAALLNFRTSTLDQVKLLQFSGPPEKPKVEFRVDAERAHWRADSGWVFLDGTLREFTGQGQREWAIRFVSLNMPRLTEKPQDFMIETKDAQQMNYRELQASIERKRRNGIQITRDEVELWLKISMPLSSFIIVLFGAPLAVYRRNLGPGIGMALGLVVYMVFMGSFLVTRTMGYNGMISPFAAAWTSNLVFGLSGVIFFLKVRK
jgi:lipopolysaccharide export system permease protein